MSVHNAATEDGIGGMPNIIDPGDGGAIDFGEKNGGCALIIGAGTEARTMRAPAYPGQRVRLNVYSINGGTAAVTSAAVVNPSDNTVMTFNAVTDSIDLIAQNLGGALEWAITTNIGVALS